MNEEGDENKRVQVGGERMEGESTGRDNWIGERGVSLRLARSQGQGKHEFMRVTLPKTPTIRYMGPELVISCN